jgi:hypothetical protein
VIELNRAVAHGLAFRPSAGLALLARARADGALDDYPLAVAAEAELTARNGDRGRAAELFRQAAGRMAVRRNAARCSTAPTRCSDGVSARGNCGGLGEQWRVWLKGSGLAATNASHTGGLTRRWSGLARLSYDVGDRRMTGISRSVLRWYSAKPGAMPTMRRQARSRSCPDKDAGCTRTRRPLRSMNT